MSKISVNTGDCVVTALVQILMRPLLPVLLLITDIDANIEQYCWKDNVTNKDFYQVRYDPRSYGRNFCNHD